VSTIGATSSPPGPAIPDLDLRHVPFLDLGSDDFGDEESDPTYGANSRASKSSDTEKTLAVLEFIKTNFPRFSLKDLLTALFTSDNASIKNVTNSYLGTGGYMHILETIVGDKGTRNQAVCDWIIGQATAICRKEVSRLTDDAADGHYYEEAKSLRIPAGSVSVQLLQSFSIPKLQLLYESTTPQLQTFLKTVIGKEPPPPEAANSAVHGGRNPDLVRYSLIFIFQFNTLKSSVVQ
jgi:hypothetical protein